jgi:lipoprotein-anchoring transpeptidase ErfK/SrfK
MQKDYYPILARAVSALESNTEAARRTVFDRARLAIMDAGLTREQTQAERSALEAAIDRIEDELRTAAAPRATASPPRRDASPAPPPDTPAAAEPASRRAAYWRPALAGAAVIVVAVIAYAVWPRPDAPGRDPEPRQTAAPGAAATRSTDGSAESGLSYVYRRQLVYYRTVHPPGTLVIAKSQRNLYVVRPNVSAMRYTIGVGRGCTNAVGLLTISDKREAPAAPPMSVSATRMAGSRDGGVTANLSGDLALALGDTGLRIEGTDPPVKDGDRNCFALANEDMADLYERVAANARVVIN